MTRVVHVVPNLVRGGVLHHLRAVSALAPQGFQSSIVSIFDLDDAEVVAGLSIPVVALHTPIGEYRNLQRLVSRLMVVIRDIGADLVHSHHCFSDIYAAPAAAELNIPAIRTVHGITQATWEAPLERRQVLIDWPATMIRKELALEPNVVLTLVVSDELRSRLHEYGLPAEKLRVCYPGVHVPPARAHSAHSPHSDGTVLIGFFHRLEPVKNPQALLDLVPLLRARGLRPRIVLLDRGSLAHEVMTAVHDRALEESFTFVCPTDAIWDSVPPVDVLLVTSLTEGVPLIMLEAMARGVPVVAVAVGGIPEAIIHCRSGFLAAAGDLGALADGIATVVRGGEPVARIVSAAHATVMRRFTLRRHLRELAAAYGRCMARQP